MRTFVGRPKLLYVVLQSVLVQHQVAHVGENPDLIFGSYHYPFVVELRRAPKPNFPSLTKIYEVNLHRVVLHKRGKRLAG